MDAYVKWKEIGSVNFGGDCVDSVYSEESWPVAENVVVNGNVKAQMYVNQILTAKVRLFMLLYGPYKVFQHDSAWPHKAVITHQLLAHNKVNVLEWPANSPGLSPIEHFFNELCLNVKSNDRVLFENRK